MPIPVLALGAAALGGQLLTSWGASRGASQARRDANARGRAAAEDTVHYNPFNTNGTLRGGMGTWDSRMGTMFNDTLVRTPQQYAFNPASWTNQTASTVNTGQFDPNGGGGTGFKMPDWINTELGTPGEIGVGENYMNDPRMFNDMMSGGIAGLIGPGAMSGGFNLSQDALMQMLKGNGGYNSITPQLDPTNGMQLNQLVQDGSNFNNSDLFGALAPMEQRTQDEGLRALQASSGSLGRRFGTAMADRSSNFLQQAGEDANLRRQNLARDSFEAAQGRRVQASGLINQRDQIIAQILMANQGASIDAQGNLINAAAQAGSNAVNAYNGVASANNGYNSALSGMVQQGMQGATSLALGNQNTRTQTGIANANNFLTAQEQRLRQSGAQNTFNQNNATSAADFRSQDLGRLASLLQSNAQSENSVGMNNANQALNTAQTNTQQGLSSFLGNQQVTQAQQAQLLQMIFQGQNLDQSNMNRGLQALGLKYGQPVAPTSAGTMLSGVGQGVGDIASILALLQGRKA